MAEAYAAPQQTTDGWIHVQAIAWINIAFAIMGFLAALVVLLIGGIAGGSATAAGQKEAGLIAGGVMTAIAVFVALLSLPQLLAGIGLLKQKNWGRILAFIVGALNLLNIPFGTALGVYTFWALTRPEIAARFQ